MVHTRAPNSRAELAGRYSPTPRVEKWSQSRSAASFPPSFLRHCANPGAFHTCHTSRFGQPPGRGRHDSWFHSYCKLLQAFLYPSVTEIPNHHYAKVSQNSLARGDAEVQRAL